MHSWVPAHREKFSHFLPPHGPSFSTGHPAAGRARHHQLNNKAALPRQQGFLWLFTLWKPNFFPFTVSTSIFFHNMGDDYFFKQSTVLVTFWQCQYSQSTPTWAFQHGKLGLLRVRLTASVNSSPLFSRRQGVIRSRQGFQVIQSISHPTFLIVSFTHAINIWLFSSCFLIMSIIAVPDHFYYSSLRSLQSASKLSGNEIPVLKAWVQIEGHQLHWQGAISSAIQRCHHLLTCSSKVFSSVFVAITALCFVHSSPSDSLCCLGLLHPIKNVSGRLFSRCLSSQVLHPQVHAPSQIESCNLFSFLLGVSTSHYSFLINSSKFSRVSWFHFLQNFCFKKQNHDLKCNQIRYPAQKKKKASECGKKERLCRNEATLPPFHISSTGTGYPFLA